MKLKKYNSKKYRRGSILGLVLVIGLCLAILGWGMLKMGFGARVNSVISVSAITAREAADAGIAKALYEMNLNFPAFPVPGERPPATLDNSDAVYQYRVDPYGENYLITSTGFSDRGQKVVYAVTGIRNYIGPYAVIVSDKIELKQDSFIDGYDSTLGRYGVPGNFGLPGVVIGTTYAGPDYRIWLRNNVVVMGDVVVGPGGDPDEIIWDQANPGATTGPRYAMTSLPEIMSIVVPPPDIDLGDIVPADFDPNYIIDGTGVLKNYNCGDIRIPGGSTLEIVGDVNLCITGTLDLQAFSMLKVEKVPWSSARIFLYGDLEVGNGAWINNETEKARNFWLFGKGTSPAGEKWTISNGGWYYGVYYGPNAVIDVKESAVFYGSILGKDFLLRESAQVHYDVDLSRNDDYDTGYGIDRWWEE